MSVCVSEIKCDQGRMNCTKSFTHFLLHIVLTIANSSREKKIKKVQTRNQMSINLT